MFTGVTSFSKLSEMTAIYPFAGGEVLFTIGLAAFFVVFIINQIALETSQHKTIIGNFTASPAE